MWEWTGEHESFSSLAKRIRTQRVTECLWTPNLYILFRRGDLVTIPPDPTSFDPGGVNEDTQGKLGRWCTTLFRQESLPCLGRQQRSPTSLWWLGLCSSKSWISLLVTSRVLPYHVSSSSLSILYCLMSRFRGTETPFLVGSTWETEPGVITLVVNRK